VFLSRAEPEYYEAVTTPMDLNMIQQKLKNEEYDDVEQMSSDVQLIVSNAKMVYGVSSDDILSLFCLFLDQTKTPFNIVNCAELRT